MLDRLGSTLQHALVLCAAGVGVGAVLVLAAFALAPTFAVFSALFAAGEFAMFMTQVRPSCQAGEKGPASAFLPC